MLEIVKFNEDEYDFPCLLVLGCFDGLHIGHYELLKKAKLQAKINGLDLGVMMFTDGKGGKVLYSFEERMSFLEQFNVKFVLQIDFNNDFKQIKPLEFLGIVEDKLNVKAYMSGKDFRFGQGAKGKSSTLKSYADDEDNSIWYMPVKDVLFGDEKVSTTAIKKLLEEGNVLHAGELLGRNYTVSGTVVHGADRGEKLLDCPTMNITYPEYKFEVKQGVYKVKCRIGENEYEGVANYGARPTFNEKTPVLEVHLNNFNEDVYDQTVTVEFIDYLRDIQKFDSAEQLSEQLKNDLAGNYTEKPAEVAEEVVEEVAEVIEEQPVEEVAEVIEEQPVEELTEEVAEEITEEQFEEQLEEAVDETVAEQFEEIFEVEETTEEIFEEVNEEQPQEQSEEQTEESEEPLDEVVSD